MENYGSNSGMAERSARSVDILSLKDAGMKGLSEYNKIPLSKVSALGVAFEPLALALQASTKGGQSGLYMVTVKDGGHLAYSKEKEAFIGAVLKSNNQVGGGQASLTPISCNPAMLFMAVTLMCIDKKLDGIQETQREIFDFIKQKERAKLRGNLNVLSDIHQNYRYNWNSEKYKSNKHIQVQEIKRESEQSILFYQERIDKSANKRSLLHSDQNVKGKLDEIRFEFKEYQLSVYLYAYASFLETLLLENFEQAFLDSTAQKIESYAYRYRELYAKTYEQIEEYAKSSIQSHLIGGLAGVSKAAGSAVAKMPVVSRSQLDENLLGAGDKLGRLGTTKIKNIMGEFVDNRSCRVGPFVEGINAINSLHNQPLEIFFDEENMYMSNA